MDNNSTNTTLYTTEELSRKLNITTIHIYKLVEEGMPAINISTGNKATYRFCLLDVMEWLNQRTKFKK
jgi:excisionase family DNA binding protein